jgi:hypothetical protein
MKKVSLFILCAILAGCTTLQTINKPSETVANPKCENVAALRVFQVLDKFVLAETCDATDERYCFGHTVYFAKEKDKIYYDEQKIVPAEDQCFEYVGTYKYTTRAESNKVVPKAKLVSSRIANPEYEIWKKEQANKDTNK